MISQTFMNHQNDDFEGLFHNEESLLNRFNMDVTRRKECESPSVYTCHGTWSHSFSGFIHYHTSHIFLKARVYTDDEPDLPLQNSYTSPCDLVFMINVIRLGLG